MRKVLVVFGTRPEAIKMAPLVKIMENRNDVDFKICVTAQHRQMLDQILDVFNIKPDYDLNIMSKNQDLYDVTFKILCGMKNVLNDFKPDVVLVHGDTTTASATALAAFYQKIKVAHIEAGLRTYNLYNPWPEEANRQIVGILSGIHFAPTTKSAENLIKEGKDKKNIFVTGNTVIDALFYMIEKIKNDTAFETKILSSIENKYKINNSRKFILVTGHRRENFGEGFLQICEALKTIAINNPNIDIVYPVHLNPNVQKPVKALLVNISNIYLVNPLKYEEFVYLMSNCYFIITDSGGVQEEAPSLGKPILVMRETTERPEAIEAGTVKLVGTCKSSIIKAAQELIDDEDEYKKMSKASNPYGDGKACEKILEILVKKGDCCD
ncbi:UDP-N-acetylglucosamine 2-epimerase (non-hydrolyzing) [Campylobacter lari]|uniref:non-hydrolyzing UDP-N-acetylglucosamine 2-epimerase n=1 Tax=Campylobacter lari TaxID=201 RepID=UPI00142C9E59|nr:UDP-N-acetylglucosamine 2-epimerase (non-hydrolyzing) [Campylobacter lari]EDP6837167.1 UDP-N-acetylglucosamine 2-epimerase (non-hydrolyzing) [Campylobacter lari]EGK8006518.1 UDP-N-acetylglucosamine 2-epimerase (non-hydrolyzing) [Campylobacter lari]EHL8053715.1 UDP-N-acetylglucosamine 2-epimerase (non-hydrolyzing) [Campylobacter lari]MCR2058138.1 UDP-N-acetylglucosamine 2-epimerase (non-hydrolyzing) [Campylobacter lari subsp. concheus]MCR2074769.1 UDP-N-acetylglucosamine 2-epimerase (non-hyd